MESSTLGRQDRTRCAADAHDRDLATTSRTSTPTASRKAARCSRTCSIRTSRSQVGAAPRSTRSADGPAARHRRARGRDGQAVTRRATSSQTGNALDIAIQGRGFFQILMPDGTHGYTRDGSFQINAQGQLVTSSGYQLQPGITIPNGAQCVTIGADGVVSVPAAGQSTPVQVGTLQLADFINPAGLQPRGENLFVETAVERPAASRNAGLERPRHGRAGLARDLQRQRGRGAGEHDRDATRVRDELARRSQTTDQMLQHVTNSL